MHIEGNERRFLPWKEKKGVMYVEELNSEAMSKEVKEMEHTVEKFMVSKYPLNE